MLLFRGLEDGKSRRECDLWCRRKWYGNEAGRRVVILCGLKALVFQKGIKRDWVVEKEQVGKGNFGIVKRATNRQARNFHTFYGRISQPYFRSTGDIGAVKASCICYHMNNLSFF